MQPCLGAGDARGQLVGDLGGGVDVRVGQPAVLGVAGPAELQTAALAAQPNIYPPVSAGVGQVDFEAKAKYGRQQVANKVHEIVV